MCSRILKEEDSPEVASRLVKCEDRWAYVLNVKKTWHALRKVRQADASIIMCPCASNYPQSIRYEPVVFVCK